jgi:hypothetical protein
MPLEPEPTFIVIEPPRLLNEFPLLIDISPLLSIVLEPVPIDTMPLTPTDEVPLLNTTNPLLPLVPELDELIIIDPLVD